MAKELSELRGRATTIKNAVEEGENTATRVGSLLEDIIDAIDDGGTGGTGGGVYTAGTGIDISSNNRISVKPAKSTELGGIKTNFQTNVVNRAYKVSTDSEGNAYVNVPSVLGALGDLSDVRISSAANGHIIVYRNGVWVNEANSGGSNSGGGTNPGGSVDDTKIRNEVNRIFNEIVAQGQFMQALHDEMKQEVNSQVNGLLANKAWYSQLVDANGNINYQGIGQQIIGSYNVITSTTTAWSTLQTQVAQNKGEVSTLKGQVATLVADPDKLTAIASLLEMSSDDLSAMGKLESMWTTGTVDDTNKYKAAEWYLSAYRNYAAQGKTFSQVISDAGNNLSGAISQLTTKVETIEGNYVTSASLTSMVEDKVTGAITQGGFVTKNSLGDALSYMYSSDRQGTVDSMTGIAAVYTSVHGKLAEELRNTQGELYDLIAGMVVSPTPDSLATVFVAKNGLDQLVAGLLAQNANTDTKAQLSVMVSGDTSFIDAVANKMNFTADKITFNSNDTTFNGAVTVQGALTALSGKFNNVVAKEVSVYRYDDSRGANYYNINEREGFIASDGKTKLQSKNWVELTPYYIDLITSDSTTYHNIVYSQGIEVTEFVDEHTRYAVTLDPDFGLQIMKGNNTDQNTSIRIDRFDSDEQIGMVITGNYDYTPVIKLCHNDDSYDDITISYADTENSSALAISCDVLENTVSNASDATLKDVISDTALTVEQVANAPAVNFTWKKDAEKENKKVNVGTLAQYWNDILPEAVTKDKEGKLYMSYDNASMVSAIVTAKEVVALKAEVAELKGVINELKAQIAAMSNQ